jgi:hypothetical protein
LCLPPSLFVDAATAGATVGSLTMEGAVKLLVEGVVGGGRDETEAAVLAFSFEVEPMRLFFDS